MDKAKRQSATTYYTVAVGKSEKEDEAETADEQGDERLISVEALNVSLLPSIYY